jgi:hypothetical protein
MIVFKDVNSKVINESNYLYLTESNFKSEFIEKYAKLHLNFKNINYIFFEFKDYKNNLNLIVNKIDLLKNLKVLSNDVCFYALYDDEPNYNVNDVKALITLQDYLTGNFNKDLLFPIDIDTSFNRNNKIELKYSWGFEKVLNANLKVNNIVNQIKNSDCSPYEKYLQAYSWVTQFMYTKEPKGEPYNLSRRMVDVLNGDFIVCMGYCSLLKAMLDKLNIPSVIERVFFKNSWHARLLVNMMDYKHNINGYFVSDPTQDAKLPLDLYKKYAHHLIPINLNLLNHYVDASTNTEIFYENFDLLEKFNSFNLSEKDKEIMLVNRLKELTKKYEVETYFTKQIKTLMDNKLIDEDVIEKKYKNLFSNSNFLNEKYKIEYFKNERLEVLKKAKDKNEFYIYKMHEKVLNTKPIPTSTFYNAFFEINSKFNLGIKTEEQIKNEVITLIKYNINFFKNNFKGFKEFTTFNDDFMMQEKNVAK